MGKVIVDFDTLHFATQLHAPLNTFVLCKPLYGCANIYSDVMCRRYRSHGILHIVHARHIPIDN